MKKLNILAVALLFTLTSCGGLFPSFDNTDDSGSQQPSDPSTDSSGEQGDGGTKVSQTEWESFFNANNMLTGNYRLDYFQSSEESSFSTNGINLFDNGRIKTVVDRSSYGIETSIESYYLITSATSTTYRGYSYIYEPTTDTYNRVVMNGYNIDLLSRLNLLVFPYSNFRYDSNTKKYVTDNSFNIEIDSSSNTIRIGEAAISFKDKTLSTISFTYRSYGTNENSLYTYQATLSNFRNTKVTIPSTDPSTPVDDKSKVTSGEWSYIFDPSNILNSNVTIRVLYDTKGYIMNIYNGKFRIIYYEGFEWNITGESYFDVRDYNGEYMVGLEYRKENDTYKVIDMNNITASSFISGINFYSFGYYDFSYDDSKKSYHRDVATAFFPGTSSYAEELTNIDITFEDKKLISIDAELTYGNNKKYKVEFVDYGSTYFNLPDYNVDYKSDYYITGSFIDHVLLGQNRLTRDINDFYHFYSEPIYFKEACDIYIYSAGEFYGSYAYNGHLYSIDSCRSSISNPGYYVIHFHVDYSEGNKITIEERILPTTDDDQYYVCIGNSRYLLEKVTETPYGMTIQYTISASVKRGDIVSFRQNDSYDNLNVQPEGDYPNDETYNNYYFYDGYYYVQNDYDGASIYLSFINDGTITFWITGGSEGHLNPYESTPRTLINVSVDYSAAKTTYYVGEELIVSSLIVTAHYSDGTEEVVPSSEWSYNVASFDSPGEYTVSIYYGSFTCSYTVNVYEAAEPTYTYYLVGTMNSWNYADSNYQLTQDTDNATHYYFDNIYIDVNDSFKVSGVDSEGTVSYYTNSSIWDGCNFELYSENNLKVLVTGNYRIDFYVNSENDNHIILTLIN